jgi:hypothetical protein
MSAPDATAIASGSLGRLGLAELSSAARRRLAYGALGTLLVASLVFALGAASGPSLEVPASKFGFPEWLAGPLPDVGLAMTSARFISLLTLMALCQGLVLALSGALRVRYALGAIVAAHLIFTLAPPVLSPDVFGYLAYARMGVLHDLNPYVQAPFAIPGDEVYGFVRWRTQIDPYGPLFTLVSYPLGLLSVAAGLWTSKAAAGLVSLGLVALVWASARRLGVAPLGPTLFVGLNPFLLLYGVGGAHNDLLMMALAMLAAFFVLGRREALGGGTLVAAIAVKASAGLLLPFVVLGAVRGRRVLVGAAVAGAAVIGASLLAFGIEGAQGMLGALETQSEKISSHNVPNGLGWALGFGGVTAGVRAVAAAVLVGSLATLLVQVRRERLDWVTAAGWGMLALLVTTTWLMHWYLVWLLPLAALGRSRPLKLAALVLPAVMVVTGLPPVPK